MKKAILLLAFFSIVSLLQAQTDRLQNLKDQRNSAIERANAPINARYVSELKKLLRISTTSGQLEEAIKIKAEIALYDKGFSKDTGTSSKKKFTKDYLVGTKWMQGEAMLKFEKVRFGVYHKENDGTYKLGGYRNWEIHDVAKRQIKVIWNTGEEIVTLSRKLNVIESSKPVMTLIEEE